MILFTGEHDSEITVFIGPDINLNIIGVSPAGNARVFNSLAVVIDNEPLDYRRALDLNHVLDVIALHVTGRSERR